RITSELDRVDGDLSALAGALGGNEASGQRNQASQLQRDTGALRADADRAAQIPPEVLVSPFEAKTRNVAPNEPSYVAFYAPAVIALLLQHLAITLIALSIVRERLLGAMELFRVAPVSTRTIVLGKTIAFAI